MHRCQINTITILWHIRPKYLNYSITKTMYRFLSQNFAISQKMLWRPLGRLTRFEALWSEVNQFLVNITLLHL